MTERVMIGHVDDGDGYRVARPWRWPRAGNPEGGLVSTVADQLAWARFSLGDGSAPDGTRVLGTTEIGMMHRPTAPLLGNTMGDAVGLGWFLRDIGGMTTLGHQGTTNGQFAELRLVPQQRFAVVALTNGGPAGTALMREVVERTLAEYVGLRPDPPRSLPYDPARHGEVVGSYANDLARVEVTVDHDEVEVQFVLQPGAAARMGDLAPRFDPATVSFTDEVGGYVVAEGAFAGEPGAFPRGDDGHVTELVFGGRWYRRVET